MRRDVFIEAIYLSEGHDFKGRHGQGRLNHDTRSVKEAECVEGMGLKGDRYFGYEEDYKGQISLISAEAVEAVAKDLGAEVEDWSAFRRNVVIRGIDLKSLVGTVFSLWGVRFEGVEQCKPCYWMDEAIGEGAFEALKDRGGLRARILSDGKIQTGVAVLEVLDKLNDA